MDAAGRSQGALLVTWCCLLQGLLLVAWWYVISLEAGADVHGVAAWACSSDGDCAAHGDTGAVCATENSTCTCSAQFFAQRGTCRPCCDSFGCQCCVSDSDCTAGGGELLRGDSTRSTVR